MKRYSIVFDNKCAVCGLGARSFKSLGLMSDELGIELDSFQDNAIACNVDPNRACDEMAVIDLDTLEVTYGYDGWVDIISLKSNFLARLMKLGLVKSLLNPVYIFFASNRRILAPLEVNESTCEPKLKKGYRVALLMLLALFAGFITYKKGEVLSTSELFGFLNGWKLISVTGAGWLITGLLYQKANKWDYWGHLAVIAGTAILLQSFALVGYTLFPNLAWVIGSMILSDLLMIWMHFKRVKMLGVSQKQTFIWWLILHFSAGVLLTIYYL